MTRCVARLGDPDLVHCSPMVRAQGAPKVLVNGLCCQRIGDLNTVHTFPAGNSCPTHTNPIFTGGKVLVNGLPIGHIGDITCTSVAAGAPKVLAN